MSSYIYEQAHLKEVDDDRGVCVDGCTCACMKHRDQNNFTDLIISLRFICVSVVSVMMPFLILNLFFFFFFFLNSQIVKGTTSTCQFIQQILRQSKGKKFLIWASLIKYGSVLFLFTEILGATFDTLVSRWAVHFSQILLFTF